MRTLLSAGSKAIDWVQLSGSIANTSSLNLFREMLKSSKCIISLTNVPVRTQNFIESLLHAGKRPSSTTVSEAVLSTLILSSFFVSLGAKVLRNGEITHFSGQTFKELKLFKNVVSLASKGKDSFIKTSQLFAQVKEINAFSLGQNLYKKKYLFFKASLNLYSSGSKLGLRMLNIAALVGVRIRPLVFLSLGTSAIAASVLSYYSYQREIKLKKLKLNEGFQCENFK